MSKRFVIDTSIAKSAGREDAVHPTSQNCRNFLLAILDNGHCLVLTPDISAEWKTHASSFTQEWRATMYQKGRIYLGNVPQLLELKQEVLNCCETVHIQKIVEKDWLLVEAALAYDKLIASYEQKCYRHFKTVSFQVTQLQTICWLNLMEQSEAVFSWLENGAREREEAQFYLRPPQS